MSLMAAGNEKDHITKIHSFIVPLMNIEQTLSIKFYLELAINAGKTHMTLSHNTKVLINYHQVLLFTERPHS